LTQLLWIGDAHDEQNKKAITRLHEILKRRPENRQWIQQDKERVMEFKTKPVRLAKYSLRGPTFHMAHINGLNPPLFSVPSKIYYRYMISNAVSKKRNITVSTR
jgi:hypothetical protein